MASAVYCIANSDSQAVQIANRLRKSGFSASDISVLAPDRSGVRVSCVTFPWLTPEGTDDSVTWGTPEA